MKYQLAQNYKPAGDQPRAIKKLAKGVRAGYANQTLLGVTGSGKTFTVANIINKFRLPVLILAHNKTLVAQLTQEYRTYFPKNAVEYFVSYYDYYQPEAYLPGTDTYIEKEAQINEEIDRLRHSATQALLTRKDVIVVASVSAIYNIGSPRSYQNILLSINKGQKADRQKLINDLLALQFIRKRNSLTRGNFLVKGNVFEVMPSDREQIIRFSVEGGKLGEIILLDAVSHSLIKHLVDFTFFPAKHYMVDEKIKRSAIIKIKQELSIRLKELINQNKLVEADRLKRRTEYDIEMIENVGYCNGIENYSRYFDGRKPGEKPYSLLEYFPKNYLTIIDESHVTIPQIRGMYRGDRARKQTLIDYGFRLPSALDNRPLKFGEFQKLTKQVIYTSATPGEYESKVSQQVVEQIVRPTGLVDPKVTIKPIIGQVADLEREIDATIKAGERALVTTLTKKQAEDLSEYLEEKKYKVQYLHSDVDTLGRIEILTKLRKGEIDIVVGVNLLREGLDLPEVSLVAILDADKEGFLRSETALIQTIGRTARNVAGRVILYGDVKTGSMKRAIAETNRRRKLQLAYNKKRHITPRTIQKKIGDITADLATLKHARKVRELVKTEQLGALYDTQKIIRQKEQEMRKVAKELNFELATILRDEIIALKKLQKKQKPQSKAGTTS